MRREFRFRIKEVSFSEVSVRVVCSRRYNGILSSGETTALGGRNGWPPDVRSLLAVAAIISYRRVQLVGTRRNPANLYLAFVSHEYSRGNHSVLHELLHYYTLICQLRITRLDTASRNTPTRTFKPNSAC